MIVFAFANFSNLTRPALRSHRFCEGFSIDLTQPEPEPEQLSMTKVKIVCNNGTVNIRVGNGTDYARITAVPDGTVFEHIATAANGWHAVKVGSQVGWVSGKYSEITTA